MNKKILEAILATANDIDAYLEDDSVMLECYQKDIGHKLQALHDEVELLTNPEPCNMDEDGVGCKPKDNDR